MRASLEVIGGDFNMAQASRREALSAALRPTGALGTFVPVFPPGTITNVTYNMGVRWCIAIDPILLRRNTQIVQSPVLPSPTSHSLRQSLPDIRYWTFVSWRRTTPEHIQRVVVVLNVLWGLMPNMLLPPNVFLHALGPRLPLLPLLTYMSGSYSRNEYTIAATNYLMSETSATPEDVPPAPYPALGLSVADCRLVPTQRLLCMWRATPRPSSCRSHWLPQRVLPYSAAFIPVQSSFTTQPL